MAGTMLLEDQLNLEPLPQSAGAGRRFVGQCLIRADKCGWTESAELAVSELVTNAVVHARTGIRVSVRITDTSIRIDVFDDSATVPVLRRHDLDSTTGRGLGLVSRVSSQCGVERLESGGKRVWFLIDDNTPAFDPMDLFNLDFESLLGDESDKSTVVLENVPAALWLVMLEHQAAMLRESLLFRAHQGSGSVLNYAEADHAQYLLVAATEVALTAAKNEGLVGSQLPNAYPLPLPDAPSAFRIDLHLNDEQTGLFGVLQDVLDEAESLASKDQLLIRPALPEVVALRDWACEQAISQAAGVLGSPWFEDTNLDDTPYRFATDFPQWDDSIVRLATQAVVAADDANRILAMSPAAEDLLGWKDEDLRGRRVVTIVPPRLREMHVAGFTRHLTTGETHVLGVEVELPVLLADSSEVQCRFMVERAQGTGRRAVYLAWLTAL